MRLSTVNEALARRFEAMSDMAEARRTFETIFFECLRRNDGNSDALLGNDPLIQALRAGRVPGDAAFASIRDEMDDRYFDAEDGGRDEEGRLYFSWARLMAALSLARDAARSAPAA